MNILKVFDIAFERAKEKNWDYIVVLIDIHDTIFKGTFSQTENYEYLGKSKETLQLMSNCKDIKIILWSSTFKKNNYIMQLHKDNINVDAFNKNIEGIQNTEIACFDEKPFFNVGIDNAFGFDPENDWQLIYDYLINKYQKI